MPTDVEDAQFIKESADRRVDAWYAQIQWDGYYMGYPFDWKKLPPGKKVRVSAMVKTTGVVGEVRLKAIYAGYESMLYRNKEGIPAKDATIEVSDSLAGDNDWTPLSLSFTTQDPWNFISLEIEGTGKVWFDNVVVEEVE